MGQVMDCDNCNKILSFSDRVTLTIPSDQHAGIMIELCLDCAQEILTNPNVETAVQAFEAKVAAVDVVLPSTPPEPELETLAAAAEAESPSTS